MPRYFTAPSPLQSLAFPRQGCPALDPWRLVLGAYSLVLRAESGVISTDQTYAHPMDDNIDIRYRGFILRGRLIRFGWRHRSQGYLEFLETSSPSFCGDLEHESDLH